MREGGRDRLWESAEAGSLTNQLQTTKLEGRTISSHPPDSEKLRYPKGSRPPMLSPDKWEPSKLWPIGDLPPPPLTEALGGLRPSRCKWCQGRIAAAGWSSAMPWVGERRTEAGGRWKLPPPPPPPPGAPVPRPGALGKSRVSRLIPKATGGSWPHHQSSARNGHCALEIPETVRIFPHLAILSALGALV